MVVSASLLPSPVLAAPGVLGRTHPCGKAPPRHHHLVDMHATGNLEQSGNQTKKRKVQEDDDEEEKHENSHEGDVDSSPIHKKKAEVV
ncbi:hypothetical protein RIF29_19987 [Crotalaria pallida]|uniref:Uncharacterized protein n=1 Tax=Crotalaria pallida TaxID=3830 RepID=A0AAN9F8S5_CROPI